MVLLLLLTRFFQSMSAILLLLLNSVGLSLFPLPTVFSLFHSLKLFYSLVSIFSILFLRTKTKKRKKTYQKKNNNNNDNNMKSIWWLSIFPSLKLVRAPPPFCHPWTILLIISYKRHTHTHTRIQTQHRERERVARFVNRRFLLPPPELVIEYYAPHYTHSIC